jgi:hypothetical protein
MLRSELLMRRGDEALLRAATLWNTHQKRETNNAARRWLR